MQTQNDRAAMSAFSHAKKLRAISFFRETPSSKKRLHSMSEAVKVKRFRSQNQSFRFRFQILIFSLSRILSSGDVAMHHPIQMKPADTENRNACYYEASCQCQLHTQLLASLFPAGNWFLPVPPHLYLGRSPPPLPSRGNRQSLLPIVVAHMTLAKFPYFLSVRRTEGVDHLPESGSANNDTFDDFLPGVVKRTFHFLLEKRVLPALGEAQLFFCYNRVSCLVKLAAGHGTASL
ncbi:unnamed protein product [Cyprideis torosa]|uniref:Uncharacterized protein n=1 Tax=Cyprideis torosa TaxID=163714 RepID=A0A7R8ZH06_9CRUS|nr:unnamed protein product [Cyprideis torosa]CAG0882597.1 unnamed protein product [Cyprideis torosa]